MLAAVMAMAVMAVIAWLAMPAAAQARDLGTAASVAGRLQAVACGSSASCWAVGNLYGPHGGSTAFIEHWDGSTWQEVPSQNPPASSSSELDGVACAQVTSCWVVGYYANPTGTATLPYAEHWNGQAWSEMTMPYPAHESLKVNLMRAVSCPSATLCFADGAFLRPVHGVGYEASLIERWNGQSWQIVPSPALPHSTTTDLQGLSCAGVSACWATGDWLNQPDPAAAPIRGGALGYQWNGHEWTAAAITDTRYAKSVDLYAASCGSLRTCMAIGSQSSGSPKPDRPYAERWTGSSWVTAPLSTTSGMYLTVEGVSCATGQTCMAVGFATGPVTTVEQWNGSSWAIVPSPNPAGALGSELYGVTCPQVTSCWAVGLWYDNTGTYTLVERWNGTTWTIAAS